MIEYDPILDPMKVGDRIALDAAISWAVENEPVERAIHAAGQYVRACAPDEIVPAAGAAKRVYGHVAAEHVVEAVASSVHRRASGQRQVLQVGGKAIVDAAVDRVGSCGGVFPHGIGGIV